MTRFKWVVEFEVDETWVADGFNLTDSRALDMIEKELSYAYGHELGARVLKAPSAKRIAKAQGDTEQNVQHIVAAGKTRPAHDNETTDETF